MIWFSIYTPVNGEIKSNIYVTNLDSLYNNIPEGFQAIEGFHEPRKKWVHNGVAIDRPIASPQVTGPYVQCGSCPIGTLVTVIEKESGRSLISHNIIGGETLRIMDPGEYIIKVSPPWPYQESEVEVLVDGN